MVTLSANTWATAQTAMADKAFPAADIAPLQETHVKREGVAKAQERPSLGWRSSFAPCLDGPGGKPSAGVALLWRPRLEATAPPHVLVEGRALSVLFWFHSGNKTVLLLPLL